MGDTEKKPLPIFMDIFRRADKNDDGKLSWQEFKTFFADGILSEEDLKTLFNKIDTHNTNNIDTEEMCAYFLEHIGDFEAVFKAADELNGAVNTALLGVSKKYGSGSLFDKFTTRFLLREVVSHASALQSPLETASDSLDVQAKEEIGDLHPTTADEIKAEGKVLAGRLGRRARRQYSNQNSYHSEGGSSALNQQVDRLRQLMDRLENKVNFDGIAEEEINVSDDNEMLIVRRKLIINESSMKNFRASLRAYVEHTNKAEGCMHVSVRSYANSTIFALYEIWASEDEWKTYYHSEPSKRFQHSNIDCLEVPEHVKSMVVPMSWWVSD